MVFLFSWQSWCVDLIERLDLSPETTGFVYNAAIVFITAILATLSFRVAKWISRKVALFLSKRSKFRVVEVLDKHKFFSYLCYQLPLWIIKNSISFLLPSENGVIVLLQRLYELCVLTLVLILTNSILNSLFTLYQSKESNRSKPVKGLLQFIQIIIVFFGVVAAISILFNIPRATMLTALGATSAILMLIFKDSITGLVAGVQLSFNKMVEIGDWITLPKYDVDGEVIDITITSVKVRNGDKSISSVPSYNLVINDSVKNWKAMLIGGSRKMTRAINLDILMVKLCTPEILEKYKKVQGVEEALAFIDKDSTLTNLGVFRAYLTYYLRHNKRVNPAYDVVVRQLQATQNGLPLEVSCFINAKSFTAFENAQSEIFEHIYAVLAAFDLNIFQAKPDEKIIGGLK